MRRPAMTPLRVRFAPSPTGYLHIGGARTAMFNWLLARNLGGTFVLRIEDTDEDRSTPEYEAVILRELRWLGLDWDEGPDVGGPYAPYRQTERMHTYRDATERMLAAGTAYRCTCTVERIDALRAEQEARKQKPRYDGHCRDLRLGPDCGPHTIRLRVETGETVVPDLIKGRVVYDNGELDDLILVRTDGVPTYNFVVVCDDVAMAITHVLRGDEHLNNTPKQLLIYSALGATPPRFGHMPLILNLEGKKMSKRDGETSVAEYRANGFLPEGMMNYLARLGWSHGDQEIFSKEDLVRLFSVEGIGTSPGKWDMDKLGWVNAHWMRTLPVERIAEAARPLFEARGCVLDERYVDAVRVLRERHRTLVELADAGAFFFVPDDRVARDEAAFTSVIVPARTLLGDVARLLAAQEDWSETALEASVSTWCAETGTKLGKVAQPVRVALTGQKVGPGLFQTLAVLGRETSLRRIRSALP
jgi:glutamyl-tRNA synthetase